MKAIDTLTVALPPSPTSSRTSTTILSTVSSDGWIRIFDLASVPASQGSATVPIKSIAEYDTKGTRLTCCALADGEMSVNHSATKRRRDEEDEDESDDEDNGEGSEVGDEEEPGSGENES